MSDAISPLVPVAVNAPITNVNRERFYTVLRGGERVTYKNIVSTSFSNSSIQFSAPPPSPRILVDRRVLLKVPVTVEFTGTAPVGQNLLQSGFDAFRAYPLSSVMETMSATINNNTTSINLADVVHPLLRYNTGRKLAQGRHSTAPSMLDQYQRYQSGDNTNVNPLGSYAENTYQTPRGGFPINVVSNTNTDAEVQAELTESLMLSPFLWGDCEKSGFLGVQTMSFNFTLRSDLSRVWSHSDGSGSTLTTVTVTIGQPQLLFRYVTPSSLAPMPSSVCYPYYSVSRYPTDAQAAIAPLASTTLNSNNIQLNSIPRRILILARQRNADQTFTSTDTYFGIRSISVNWNNNSGLLSAASTQDLYEISVKNGYEGSLSQWSGGPVSRMLGGAATAYYGTSGSVLCLEMGTDIALGPGECPGMLGTYQLQLRVDAINANTVDAITPTLYVIVISEGTLTIANNTTTAQIGVVTPQDDISAKHMPLIDYNTIREAYGGNFLSGLKDFGRGVVKGFKDVAGPVWGEFKEILPQLIKVAPALIAAAGEDPKMKGRPGRKGKKKGGVVVEGPYGGAIPVGGSIAVGGAKPYAQTAKDRADEAEAMRAYWAAKKKMAKDGMQGGKKLSRKELARRMK
jgi:hypothetical protein